MTAKTLTLPICTLVAGMILVTVQGPAASESFRPPFKSIAELTDQQRLSLAISAVNQQLVYGVIHENYLAGLRASPNSKQQSLMPPWTAAVQPIPTGEYTGMSQGTPIFQGKTALVPVWHHFREALNVPPGERVSTVPDTLFFVNDGKVVILPRRDCGPGVARLEKSGNTFRINLTR